MAVAQGQKRQGLSSVAELRKEAGVWLRGRRLELGLSQRELASRVCMDYYTFISQIEAGRGRVPADRLRDWAIALEMEPREFAFSILKYYDPHTFDMLFGLENRGEE